MKFKFPAIVVGGGINGLGIVRNLGKQCIDVYCVVDGIDAVVFSKYCRKHLFIRNFSENKKLVKSFLIDFSKETTKRAVIFSTDDLGTLMLSDLQSEMKDDYHFVLSKREIVEKLVVKRKFYETLMKNRVPYPRVLFPVDSHDAIRMSRELGYPLYIRPAISQYFSRRFHKKGFVANSEKELSRLYCMASKYRIEVMLQEIIPGLDNRIYGVSGFLNRESLPLALFAYHRLRGWPRIFGNNSLIESVPICDFPFLKETVLRYLKVLGYYGIMEAEFKLDPRDDSFKLLEINARSWWQNMFPTKCGVNIILTAYLDAIGEKTEYSEDYVAGLKWINLITDFVSSLKSMDILKKSWLSSLQKVNDFAMFDLYDPIPVIADLVCQSGRLLSKSRNAMQKC